MSNASFKTYWLNIFINDSFSRYSTMYTQLFDICGKLAKGKFEDKRVKLENELVVFDLREINNDKEYVGDVKGDNKLTKSCTKILTEREEQLRSKKKTTRAA